LALFKGVALRRLAFFSRLFASFSTTARARALSLSFNLLFHAHPRRAAPLQVLFRFRFRVPPHFALVIRALGALEGTVIRVDPSFKVVARAYPYVLNQVLRDKRPQMRKVKRHTKHAGLRTRGVLTHTRTGRVQIWRRSNSKALVAHQDRVVWSQSIGELVYTAYLNAVCRFQKKKELSLFIFNLKLVEVTLS
jgi:hypothetical protein